jgi:hypothetical protein
VWVVGLGGYGYTVFGNAGLAKKDLSVSLGLRAETKAGSVSRQQRRPPWPSCQQVP